MIKSLKHNVYCEQYNHTFICGVINYFSTFTPMCAHGWLSVIYQVIN